LYHVTPKRNAASIDKHGLLPERATGKTKCVWLATRSKIAWVLSHLASKPGKAPIPKLLVFRVEVPRSKVRRFRRGIWLSAKRLWPIDCEPAGVYTRSCPDDPEPNWDWMAAEAAALDSLTAGYFPG
jgi:hypothetical protein